MTYSRDVWSHGSGSSLRELLGSALVTLLLTPSVGSAVYFCSPWISDFVMLDNTFRQFGDLFPERDSQSEIRFSDYLVELSRVHHVRVITVGNETSSSFLKSTRLREAKDLSIRLAPDEHHEKGILAPQFYIEGSMNITHSGVWVRGEKVSFHVAHNAQNREKIAMAYLEFDRYWDNLGILSA